MPTRQRKNRSTRKGIYSALPLVVGARYCRFRVGRMSRAASHTGCGAHKFIEADRAEVIDVMNSIRLPLVRRRASTRATSRRAALCK